MKFPTVSPRSRKLPAMEFDWRAEAQRMVENQIAARGVKDPRVLDAMRRVPRHRFLPESRRDEAYHDGPLPIGCEQTISQPYIVGVMTELLAPRPDDRVLEIGTGCGYQTAILAELVAEVHTVEIIGSLANRAATTLEELGYANVRFHVGDGRLGWIDAAPYDGILVTAAPEELPPDLPPQLKPSRCLVAPVGPLREQMLWVYEKDRAGELRERRVFDVRFVPLVGGPSPDA